MTTTLKTLSALALAAATLTAVTLASGTAASANPFHGLGHGPVQRFGSHHPVISCLACNLPRPHKWNNYPWRFHHWGYYPWRYYGWEHRYNRWYWERYRYRYGWHPVGLPPAPTVAAAPAQPSAAPQGCITEHKMPDGSIVFEDLCKQISAIAPPPSADPPQKDEK